MVGSGDELARRSGVPRRTLESYLSGRSEPKATALALIAGAAGVSLDWLLLGKSAAPEEATPVGPAVDAAVLVDVMHFIEGWLAANGHDLPPVKKADVVVLAYELFKEAATSGDADGARDKITRLLRVAV